VTVKARLRVRSESEVKNRESESERETEATWTKRVRVSVRSTKKDYKYDNTMSIFFPKIDVNELTLFMIMPLHFR